MCTDTVFIENNYAMQGGGIMVNSVSFSTNGDAEYSVCSVQLNTAESQGGGIFINSSVALLSRFALQENSANEGGKKMW